MHVDFRRLTDDDLPLLHRWLGEPGVVRWWEGDDVSFDAVVRDYGSASPEPVEQWIAAEDDRDVGWIQCYPVDAYTDDDGSREWTRLGVPPTSAGIDYLIGAPADRGRGLGTSMVRAFVARIVFGARPFSHVCADPAVANVASQRVLEKCGFTPLGTFTADGVDYRLMCADRQAVPPEPRHIRPDVATSPG